MLEAILLLFLLCVAFLFLKKKSGGRVVTAAPVHNHGHRCYIENLSYEERRIVTLLAQHLSHKEYFIFNNIILPSKNTKTTQIDHIIVSRYGIFIIESKKYNHWIFAHPNRRQWVQTTPGGNKYHFFNPLFQNFAHVSALKQQLPFLKNVFFDFVVFSGTCTFKTPRIHNVLYESEMIDFIKSKQKVILKEFELLVVIGKLSLLCQTTETTNEEHIQNITEIITSQCQK